MRIELPNIKKYLYDRHWLFDNHNNIVAILDNDSIRDMDGYVLGWFEEEGFGVGHIYSVTGDHIGWIDGGGFISDIDNAILGYVQGSVLYGILKPWLDKSPEEPVLAPKPNKPEFDPVNNSV